MRGKRGESHPSTTGFGVGVTETGGIPEPASHPSPGKAPRGGWRKAAALPLYPGLAARSLELSLRGFEGELEPGGGGRVRGSAAGSHRFSYPSPPSSVFEGISRKPRVRRYGLSLGHCLPF